MESVKFKDYPEALQILARELEIPVSEEDIDARENYIKELVINFVMSGLY